MKKSLVLLVLLIFLLYSCSSDENNRNSNDKIQNISDIILESSQTDEDIDKMKLIANNYEFIVKLEKNEATNSLIEKLKIGDISIAMTEYGGFEHVGNLGFSLPTSNAYINTKPGDLVLYLGHNLCIYHGTNLWDFTKIGVIENLVEAKLNEAFKDDNVTVTLSLK